MIKSAGIRGVIFTVFAVMLVLSCGKGESIISRPAPDFTLDLLEGGQIGLTELRGKPLILYFFASW